MTYSNLIYSYSFKIIGIVLSCLLITTTLVIQQLEINNVSNIQKYLYWIFCFALMLIIFSKEKNENEDIKNWRYQCFMYVFLLFIISFLSFKLVEIISNGNLTLDLLFAVSIMEMFYLIIFYGVGTIKAYCKNEEVNSFKVNKKGFTWVTIISFILLLSVLFIFK